MSKEKPLYYWDTCIWIAWVMNENRPNREMDGVQEILESAVDNKVSIIVSDFMTTEILKGKWPDGGYEKFDKLFMRKNIKKVSISPHVIKTTETLRNYYARLGGKNISSGDAIHLATAIVYNVDQMHTFDDGGQDKRFQSLLALNGNVAGYQLNICKPPFTQLRLPGIIS